MKQCWGLVNPVMNLRIEQKCGISVLDGGILAS
jgi:hypothetical protein